MAPTRRLIKAFFDAVLTCYSNNKVSDSNTVTRKCRIGFTSRKYGLCDRSYSDLVMYCGRAVEDKTGVGVTVRNG